MALVAVLSHALLFLIVLPRQDSSQPQPLAIQWLELSARASPNPEPVDSSEPAQESRPEPEPEPIAQNLPDLSQEIPASARAQIPQPSPATPSGARLRELALIAARAQVGAATPSSPGIQGFAVPRLPGEPGWLNEHLGTVAPYSDRWLEADGASGSRVVTVSGQVYCGRTRAPTAAEEFNPWRSTALIYWRACGRERPEPVDRSNPWVRGNSSARD